MFAERSDPSVVAKTGMEFEEKKPKTRSVRYNNPAYEARIPATTRIQARLAVFVHTMMARKDAAAPNKLYGAGWVGVTKDNMAEYDF